MDNTKLNELAARAMGWYESIETLGDILIHWYGDDALVFTRRVSDWNPAGCADDALIFIQKVAHGLTYELWHCPIEEKAIAFWCHCVATKHMAEAPTAALAMTLCALRASPEVTEEQIQEALK